MSKIIKTIKIVNSPFTSNLEVVGDFVMELKDIYNDSMVTIKINSNITHYEDQPKVVDPSINIRQIKVSKDTEDTQNLTFDFQKNNIQKIKIGDKNFEIKLLNIGKFKTEGQDQEFSEFEFLVTEI